MAICTIHGKEIGNHVCLYCCLCFAALTPNLCTPNSKGELEDVCAKCREREDVVLKKRACKVDA